MAADLAPPERPLRARCPTKDAEPAAIVGREILGFT
jgi:hypothetical protein